MRAKRKQKSQEYLTPEAQKALADRLARAEGHPTDGDRPSMRR